MTISTTMITNYMLAAAGFYFGISLYLINRINKQRSVSLFSAGFISLALSAVAAGTVYGFEQLPTLPPIATACWKIAMITIIVGGFLMLCAIIISSIKSPLKEWFIAFAALKFASSILCGIIRGFDQTDYSFIIYDYGTALVFVLIIQLYATLTRRIKGGLWIVFGVIIAFAATAIRQSDIKIFYFLNSKNIHHIVLMISFFMFYKGGRVLRDRKEEIK